MQNKYKIEFDYSDYFIDYFINDLENDRVNHPHKSIKTL